MNSIPGSWNTATAVILTICIVGGFAWMLLRKRPTHRPRIRVGLDARHGIRPHADERDTVALFRRIMCQQRSRLGI